HDAPIVEAADLLRVHDAEYVAQIERRAPLSGRTHLDPDTAMSAGSLTAPRRAAGAVVRAVRHVAAGRAQRSFCAVRPPGAHAKDPVSGGTQSLEDVALAWATRAIADVANRHAKGRVVSSLEGGYHLEALGRSALAHVRALGEG